ncbi:GIY-YIG nuclease family protein [Peptoniphilus duerdenii]|uniref:GIY-YIG nuclease family protein n=1 Tax=Peptoniphilus duerdenii TaxID=507750 RepID=UPI0023F2711D|nr:GIY-YIG nuclease family protein [Peptoniphilus duerdenii]
MNYYIYIMSNSSNTIIYIGFTNDLVRRVYEHMNELVDGFSKKFNTHKLVYFEVFSTAYDAIAREKQLKKWTREKKNSLIEKDNPEWIDLWDRINNFEKL